MQRIFVSLVSYRTIFPKTWSTSNPIPSWKFEKDRSSKFDLHKVHAYELLYCASFTGHNQYTFSTMTSASPSETTVASELASTNTPNMRPSTHHYLLIESFWRILSIFSARMLLRGWSFPSPCQNKCSSVRCHTSFPHISCTFNRCFKASRRGIKHSSNIF